MSRTALAGRSSVPTSDLDHNYTELYDLRELISTPGYTAAAPKLALDGSGNFLIGKTAVDFTTPGVHYEWAGAIGYGRANFVKGTGSGTGSTIAQAYYYAGTQIGTIQCTSTATSYATTSDRRLKTDITPAADAGLVLDAMQVVSHGWKHDTAVKVRWGFIAQDLHAVLPEAVHAGDDGAEVQDTWSVDKSVIIPLLVAEIQALRRRVAALEARA